MRSAKALSILPPEKLLFAHNRVLALGLDSKCAYFLPVLSTGKHGLRSNGGVCCDRGRTQQMFMGMLSLCRHCYYRKCTSLTDRQTLMLSIWRERETSWSWTAVSFPLSLSPPLTYPQLKTNCHAGLLSSQAAIMLTTVVLTAFV